MLETLTVEDRERWPLFVYGSLRPSQLGHSQVAAFVARSRPAALAGYRLRIRDGLPMLMQSAGDEVRGDLLWPKGGAERALIAAADAFEPKELYRPCRVRVVPQLDQDDSDGVETAWTFLGRSPMKGASADWDYGVWSFEDDPLFDMALEAVATSFLAYLETGGGFWDTFIRLQGDFLTLCTILERYTSLASGASVTPTKRISALRHEGLASRALELASPPPLDVLDVRTVDTRYRVPGPKSFDAWYQVRSNLVHRGKNAMDDVRLLEAALVGLHDTLAHLLFLHKTKLGSGSCSGPAQMLLPHYRTARPQENASRPA